jgi:hypothetical protein
LGRCRHAAPLSRVTAAGGESRRWPSDRRVAALERELDELHRMEEVLVAAAIAAGEPVHRSASAPPAAVLGVRIEAKATRAA